MPDPKPRLKAKRSPYIDSVMKITGEPMGGTSYGRNLGGVPNMDVEAAGLYYSDGDSIKLREALPVINEQMVYTHELGHRLDFHGDDRARKAYNAARAKYPLGRPVTGEYARQNDREQFAEAFERAMAFAQHYASLPNHPGNIATALQDLRAGDEAVPGTAAMVRYLMRTGVFANHPMREAFGEAPDARPVDKGFELIRPDRTAVTPREGQSTAYNYESPLRPLEARRK